MNVNFLSIKEAVEPIVGGYWGETVELGAGNARVIRNGDVLESGEIGPNVPERKLTEREIAKSRLHSGDILITMSGNVGRVARARKELHEDGKPYVASNFVKILRTKGNILPEYLFFLLKSPQFQRELKKHTRGVAIQNLSVGVFNQKFIPAIAKKAQGQIVSQLEETEMLKRKRREADKKMTELIPALFVKMFGAPSDWKIKWNSVTIGDVSSFITSGSRGWATYYAETGARFIRVQNLAGHKLNFDDIAFVNPPATAETIRTRVQPNDLLLAITGNTIGLSALTPEDVGEAYVSQHVAIIRPNQKIDPVFLSVFVALKNGIQEQISEMYYGQTKPALSLAQVRDLNLPLPPLPLQKEFAEKVLQIRTLESKQKRSGEQIGYMFNSLLAKI
ncbi:MAG: restriction endonuclease subunit S [Candidatus Pacebacteria bacterium]|nr:restriction endonuclease subunit S [Candidatus Paceibacterota bacterium]